MVRPAVKLKTRRSTLGATREERISSAMDSLAATSIYDYSRDSSKERNRTPIRRRVGGLRSESLDEYVPSSITMEEDGYARSPKLDATSCSITTRSSIQEKQFATSFKRASSSSRRQAARDPSPVNIRRASSMQRTLSMQGKTYRNPSPINMRRTSSSVQSSRNSSPITMRRSSSSQGQQSRYSSPRATIRRTSSSQGQSSRQSTPVNTRGNASPQRDRSPSLLRRDRSPAIRRQEQMQRRAKSRSRSRGRGIPSGGSSVKSTRSVSSSVLAGSRHDASNSNYEEKVELVAMTNEHNQSFVRILVSKTSYKPKMGEGIEAVARSEIQKNEADEWEAPAINCGAMENSITGSYNSKNTRRATGSNSRRNNESVNSNSIKKERNDVEERNARDTTRSEERDDAADAALKMCETVDFAINAVNPCAQNVGEFHTESVPGSKNRRRRSGTTSSSRAADELFDRSTPALMRMPLPAEMRDEQLRGNTNAKDYYEKRKLKKSNSWRQAIREKLAQKEKEKEERKQKKIQKRLDREAKKQIERELEIQREIEKKERERERQKLKRSNSFGPRSNSFNSAAMRKINYVTRSRSDQRSDQKLYQKSYEEIVQRHIREDEEDSRFSTSRENIFEKLKASFSLDEHRAPVRSVSFVTAGDDDIDSRGGHYSMAQTNSYEGTLSRDTAAMQTYIHRKQGTSIIGGVCDCVAPKLEDVRDLRMVDSDISESSLESDSSGSSSYYYK